MKPTFLKRFTILIVVSYFLGTLSANAKSYTNVVKIKSQNWEVTESGDAYLIPTNKGKISIYIYGLDKQSESNLSRAKKNSCIAITRFDNNDDVKIQNVKCK